MHDVCADVHDLIHVDVSQLSYLEDAPRDLTLSENGEYVISQTLILAHYIEKLILHSRTCSTVWALLLNGMLIAWDPETRTRRAKVRIAI